MTYNQDIHHRRSIRLKGYDYSQAGAYFVTVCAHGRECLFGEIVGCEMLVNEFGRIVEAEWTRTTEIRKEIELGEYVVMPNHFHGIVVITYEMTGTVGAYGHTPLHNTLFRSPSKTIGAMVRGFKSSVTIHINKIRQTPRHPVWQRNFYEHVIRNDADYNRIADYIATNPQRWAEDTLHPDNVVEKDTVVGAYGQTPLRTVPRPGGTNE